MALNISHIVKARRQAHDDGDKTYFTGTPCARGHLTLRYVTTGACKDCASLHSSKFARDFVAHRHRNAGLVQATYWVHPDDKGALDAIAEALVAPHIARYNEMTKTQSAEFAAGVAGRAAALAHADGPGLEKDRRKG